MGWDLVARAHLREQAAWNNGTAVLAITPATKDDITESAAAAGTTYQVRVRLQTADGEVCRWANFTLAASIGDTIADSGTTPTISDETPTLVDGECLITVTLPEGAYVADETVTVTIADYEAADGRTLTGGTSVLTIAADEE